MDENKKVLHVALISSLINLMDCIKSNLQNN